MGVRNDSAWEIETIEGASTQSWRIHAQVAGQDVQHIQLSGQNKLRLQICPRLIYSNDLNTTDSI